MIHFIQKSMGAEPEPPIEIEYENGYIVLRQDDNVIILNTESLEELFAEIKKQVATP